MKIATVQFQMDVHSVFSIVLHKGLGLLIQHINVHDFMFALKITYKGKDTIVGVKDGLLTVWVHDESDRCIVYADSVETESKERNIWFSAEEMDGEIEVEVVETLHLSMPLKTEQGVSIRKAPSKIERYRMLEETLKEKGLI